MDGRRRRWALLVSVVAAFTTVMNGVAPGTAAGSEPAPSWTRAGEAGFWAVDASEAQPFRLQMRQGGKDVPTGRGSKIRVLLSDATSSERSGAIFDLLSFAGVAQDDSYTQQVSWSVPSGMTLRCLSGCARSGSPLAPGGVMAFEIGVADPTVARTLTIRVTGDELPTLTKVGAQIALNGAELLLGELAGEALELGIIEKAGDLAGISSSLEEHLRPVHQERLRCLLDVLDGTTTQRECDKAAKAAIYAAVKDAVTEDTTGQIRDRIIEALVPAGAIWTALAEPVLTYSTVAANWAQAKQDGLYSTSARILYRPARTGTVQRCDQMVADGYTYGCRKLGFEGSLGRPRWMYVAYPEGTITGDGLFGGMGIIAGPGAFAVAQSDSDRGRAPSDCGPRHCSAIMSIYSTPFTVPAPTTNTRFTRIEVRMAAAFGFSGRAIGAGGFHTEVTMSLDVCDVTDLKAVQCWGKGVVRETYDARHRRFGSDPLALKRTHSLGIATNMTAGHRYSIRLSIRGMASHLGVGEQSQFLDWYHERLSVSRIDARFFWPIRPAGS